MADPLQLPVLDGSLDELVGTEVALRAGRAELQGDLAQATALYEESLAIHRELGLPIKFIGLGEKPEDLQPFDAKEFSAALFSE